MSKIACITGIRGQDGSYLAKQLLDKGYTVVGLDRRSGNSNNWRHKELGIEDAFKIEYCDLTEYHNICHIIKKYKPDYFYNLAAQSFVQTSFEQPFVTTEVNAIGVLNILEAIKEYSFDTKIYQASTSELYGEVKETPQNENTPFNPRSPYGVAKLYAHHIVKNYRESYNMFCCSGILFNHESPLRGKEFVTRKITHGLANIFAGKQDKISLGNLYAKRDWGHSSDYCRAMTLILENDKPKDYVVATGQTYTIKEFINLALKYYHKADIGYWEGEGVDEKYILDGKVIIDINPEFYRPAEVELLLGDCSKIEQELGWKREYTLAKLVEEMCAYDWKHVND